MRGRFIAVIGHGPLLERDEGAVSCLRQLGSEVRALDLWDDPASLFGEGEVEGERVRAVIVEALDRPDLAAAVLRALRREPRLERAPALLAVGEPQVARVDPAAGFDDFVLSPYVPSELYMRIRYLEWRRSEFSNEERLKVGALVIDRSAREVYVEGRPVTLTAKEFSLLAYLCENRGRVKSREQLLARVWGASYEGGPRTVDIHVRRLRAKLGAAFALQTVRGAGYKLPLDAGPREGLAVAGPLPLALSVGCPSGIGPEVAVEACARFEHPVVLVGDRAQIDEVARSRELSLGHHRVVQPGPALAAHEREPGRPSRAGGAAQLAWVDAALELVRSGQARALVTGPVSKQAIAESGAPGSQGFTGHTEHLQRRLGAAEVVMAFWSPSLSTSLVTTHLPLARVPQAITPEAVASAAYWLARLLSALGHDAPRLAVAGLNPHAGEGGHLGSEEREQIEPGVALARAACQRAGVKAEFRGPMGAESAYRLANQGVFDGVVAMYHDQATIPMKLLGFGEAVNISLGLPVVRTSVDHGTGYEIAGSGKADARGMTQALDLAHRLTVGAGATAVSGRAG